MEEKWFSKETGKECSDTLRKPSRARLHSQEKKILGTKKREELLCQMIWGLKRVFLDLWCGGQYWADVEFQWSNFHFCVGNMNKWHSTGCGRVHDKTEDPDEDWGVYLKLFLSAQLCHFFFFQQWSQPGEIHKINNRNRAKSSLNVSLGHPLRTSLSLCNNSSLLLIPETITLQFYQEKSTSHSFHPSFLFFFF